MLLLLRLDYYSNLTGCDRRRRGLFGDQFALAVAACCLSLTTFSADAFAVDLKSERMTVLSVPPPPTTTKKLVETQEVDVEDVWFLPKLTEDAAAATATTMRRRPKDAVDKSPSWSSSPQRATQACQQARGLALACGYSDFEAWLTTGGDDRSLIQTDTGTNKYHIRPQPIDALTSIFRGSCTGNPPTQRGYQAAQQLYQQLDRSGVLNEKDPAAHAQLEQTLANVFAQQRARLAQLLDLPAGAEVLLCPSGSDAEYLPVVMARALAGPDVTITNGLTQLREIGSGSAPAAAGQYFSTHAPLLGEISDDASSGNDDSCSFLAGFGHGKIEAGPTLSARAPDGSVVDAATAMTDFARAAIDQGMYPVVHSVFGGKTGLRDAGLPHKLLGAAGKHGLGVVDACQGRFTKAELHEWLQEQHAVVLFTGSKFYQAPPFCGAVIVPASIAEKLSRKMPQPETMFSSTGVGGFVTDKELPDGCCAGWKRALRRAAEAEANGHYGKGGMANNVGLALRWEAGLAGMEALATALPECRDRTEAVTEWATAVVNKVQDQQPVLDAWCVERSIVSIRVAKMGNDNDNDDKSSSGWLNMSELRDLYRWMSLDVSRAVPRASPTEKVALSTPAYIGQPVDVAESHAIVRIALGVESLLSYIGDKEGTLREDELTVQKLAAIAKHFETLKQSGL